MEMNIEYKTIVNEDGSTDYFPILDEEEKDSKHQEFLRLVDSLLKKYQ